MEIKTYTYNLIDSKMYVIIEGNSALVIDPCISEKAVKFLKDERIDYVKLILTHEHYDHISGIELFRNNFDCEVICSEKCGEGMKSPSKNGSKFFKALFLGKDKSLLDEADRIEPVSYEADVFFKGQMEIQWQRHRVFLIETPGHSPGSICISIDGGYLFTGDSLLKNNEVVTRLPGGNKVVYNDVTFQLLTHLDPDYYVYPGHGDGGKLKEFNIVRV